MRNGILVENNDVAILLPEGSRVQKPLPNLIAKWNSRMVTVLAPCDQGQWFDHEAGLKEELPNPVEFPGSPMVETQIVRLEELSKPYRGLLRIYEEKSVLEYGTERYTSHTHEWEVLLRIAEQFALISILGQGPAADDIEMWDGVLQSFRFK